jgi:hypothetical protein
MLAMSWLARLIVRCSQKGLFLSCYPNFAAKGATVPQLLGEMANGWLQGPR